MILTVTINPSVDTIYHVENFKLNHTNRMTEKEVMSGGKGINTARVIHLLHESVLATGFIGGKNGDFVMADMDTYSLPHQFIQTQVETRNAITVIHHDENNEVLQTEIVESGPIVSVANLDALFEQIKQLVAQNDIHYISLAGRIYQPKNLSISIENYYTKILDYIAVYSPHVKVAVDSSGPSLHHVITNKNKPFFIKPNIEELSEYFGKDIQEKDVPRLLFSETLKDIPGILVTLGAKGAIAKYQDQCYFLTIPKVKVANPTGSGDSTVAGLLAGLQKGCSITDALKLAIACGTANAMETKVGFLKEENVQRLLTEINVTTVSV